MTRADLTTKVRQAFSKVERPKRTMADAEVEDDRSETSRFEETDKHWWEVPHQLLARCSAPFYFLSPEDFLYYLPAYISWFLSADGGQDSCSSESLIYYLSDLERGGRVAGLLDSPQRVTVIDFLEYVKASPNLLCFHEYTKSALQRIWRKTEQSDCNEPRDDAASAIENQRRGVVDPKR
jgi:hypothetical protein